MNKIFLPNAPLKEVLFEIHWDLEYIPEEKILFDKGFERAILNFTSACQQDFKEVSILKPENIPPTAFINRVTHRFFKKKGQHPLYQLGPGVFTVNDNNKNYIWSDFLDMVINGISCLRSSYEKELIPSNIQLRYIDRVSPYIFGGNDKFDFLREHLQVNAQTYPFVQEELNDIQFTNNFSIDNDSALSLIVQTGVDKDSKEDVIEWHTFVSNKKRLSWEELIDWVQKAHETCSNTFKNMVSYELYEHFSQ
ncbi:MAG: TIGR04255 family protein [Sphingobacteriales bacterium]|nr:MAG: TIGR04255 family protein [Sphingobacteriales bacterium]